MNEELLLLLLLSLIPTCFSYFLDFCLGLPGSENQITPKNIFFGYTLKLAERRLRQRDKLKEIEKGFHDMLNSDDPGVRNEGVKLMKITIVLEGRKYFTWEYMVGMCILCTGFWVAEFTALIAVFFLPLHYFNPAILFLTLPIFSHTILRKL